MAPRKKSRTPLAPSKARSLKARRKKPAAKKPADKKISTKKVRAKKASADKRRSTVGADKKTRRPARKATRKRVPKSAAAKPAKTAGLSASPKTASSARPKQRVPIAPTRSRKANLHRAAVAQPRPLQMPRTAPIGAIFDTGLARNSANFQALSPLNFLERSAQVFPEHPAIIHGRTTISYRAFYARTRRLASALKARGIKAGDTVAVMLPNIPAMLDCHYGIAMLGAVINTLNTRLDAQALAFILDHGEAKVLITDTEFSEVIAETLKLVKKRPLVIDVEDSEYPGLGKRLGSISYDSFLASGDPEFAWSYPSDEWNAIALNYTSGTTGNPKGVVFHHRGAALMGYGNVLAANLPRHPVYLWTLPMFHCNGWCFPWTLSMVAGTHVCLRWVRAKAIYEAITTHRVTHMCGAPIVMSTLIHARPEDRMELPGRVEFITAAAPPPESVLAGMADAGFNVTHVYGLTETYGPAVVNEWQPQWDGLDRGARAAKKARQGVRYHALDGLAVMDPQTMEPVPGDAETLGEVMFRGNIVMKGYLKNPKATNEAFAGGWFHSGDLAVVHPDGYIQLKDRSKDIIISGGENISSIEIEDTLAKHPAVLYAAVVAKPDKKWGETPCAFVELKPGAEASSQELIDWCRSHLAHFKCPRHVVFREIPKTSTGKMQKYKLRDAAFALGDGT
jgi:fatty-acyl-CoA synthase